LINQGVDESIISKPILKKKQDVVGWILLAFYRANGCMCEDCDGLSTLQIRGSP
jgi:hypothetical protein